jgi:hypothetical protein
MKCFYHPAFRWKMALLVAPVVYRYCPQQPLAQRDLESSIATARIAAAV